jgi:hypothetical protein
MLAAALLAPQQARHLGAALEVRIGRRRRLSRRRTDVSATDLARQNSDAGGTSLPRESARGDAADQARSRIGSRSDADTPSPSRGEVMAGLAQRRLVRARFARPLLPLPDGRPS